jgi:hypothetical protein
MSQKEWYWFDKKMEREAREHGGEFKRIPSRNENGVGDGWCGELDRAYANTKYAVMIRTIDTAYGKMEHVCIRNANQTDVPWAAKQWIKNVLFGPERVAIEFFPKESQLVDAANMYHLWVYPEGYQQPFGLKD